MDRARKKSN
jgi:hypothetical protein